LAYSGLSHRLPKKKSGAFSQGFVDKIEEIDNNYNKFANESRLACFDYCQQQEALFQRLLKTWI